MSFVDQDDVIAVAEDVLVSLWGLIGYDVPTPLPRMTYAEAMARFGSDKPDLRMGLELVDCTTYFADTPFRVFQAPYVGAVVMPGGADQPRRQFDAWQEWAKQRGARGLAYVTRRGRRRAGRPGRQEPQRRRAGRPGRPRRRRARATASSSPPVRSSRAGPCSAPLASRSAAGGGLIDEERLELPVGRRRAAVRAGRRGDGRRRRRGRQRPVDRRPPRLHLAAGPRRPSTRTPGTLSPGPTTSSATATRSAAARSVSTAATSSAGCSR